MDKIGIWAWRPPQVPQVHHLPFLQGANGHRPVQPQADPELHGADRQLGGLRAGRSETQPVTTEPSAAPTSPVETARRQARARRAFEPHVSVDRDHQLGSMRGGRSR